MRSINRHINRALCTQSKQSIQLNYLKVLANILFEAKLGHGNTPLAAEYGTTPQYTVVIGIFKLSQNFSMLQISLINTMVCIKWMQ